MGNMERDVKFISTLVGPSCCGTMARLTGDDPGAPPPAAEAEGPVVRTVAALEVRLVGATPPVAEGGGMLGTCWCAGCGCGVAVAGEAALPRVEEVVVVMVTMAAGEGRTVAGRPPPTRPAPVVKVTLGGTAVVVGGRGLDEEEATETREGATAAGRIWVGRVGMRMCCVGGVEAEEAGEDVVGACTTMAWGSEVAAAEGEGVVTAAEDETGLRVTEVAANGKAAAGAASALVVAGSGVTVTPEGRDFGTTEEPGSCVILICGEDTNVTAWRGESAF